MTRAAAIFDLDRTLLPGSSGRVLADELRAHGVVALDPMLFEGALFTLFDKFGETLTSMAMTRQAVVRVRVGKPIRVRSADDKVATRSVMRRIEKLLPAAVDAAPPTEAQLARTYPRGVAVGSGSV